MSFFYSNPNPNPNPNPNQVGSRGWFEDDEDFSTRVAAGVREARAAYAASKRGGTKGKKSAPKKYVGPAKLPHNTANVFDSFGKKKAAASSWSAAGSGHSAPASMKLKSAVSRVNAKETGSRKANAFASAFDSDSDSD